MFVIAIQNTVLIFIAKNRASRYIVTEVHTKR